MTKYNDEELEEQLANLKYKGRFIDNWFSNFVPSPMIIKDLEWPNVEAYFAAQKTFDPKEREAIRLAKTPGEAKRLGRKVTLRRDWDEVKEDIMLRALRVKFAPDTIWHKQLLASKGLLIEWNNWGDQYWGMTLDKVGKNRLGELLMQMRAEFIDYPEISRFRIAEERLEKEIQHYRKAMIGATSMMNAKQSELYLLHERCKHKFTNGSSAMVEEDIWVANKSFVFNEKTGKNENIDKGRFEKYDYCRICGFELDKHQDESDSISKT